MNDDDARQGERGPKGDTGATGAPGRDSGTTVHIEQSPDNPTFMGLAKVQMLGVIAFLLVLAFSIQAFEVYKVAELAHTNDNQVSVNRRTTQAVCGLRDYYRQQAVDDVTFLSLTQAQRRKKYGSVGDLPDASIILSLQRTRALIRHFGPLVC